MSELVRVVGAVGLVIVVGAAALFVIGRRGPESAPPPPPLAEDSVSERLREALAEVDRLDPRWRFAELEEDRAKVADAENAAPLVSATAILIPDEIKGLDHNHVHERLRKGELDEHPRLLLDPARAALLEARKLAGYSRGRHTVKWNLDNPLLTLLPHVQATEEVVNVLTLDAELRAHEGDIDGALVSVRAALVAAHAIGDEPMLVSQQTRPAWHLYSVKALEESLRRGRATDEKLLTLQTALDEEAAEPLLRTSARAERAGLHGLMTALEKRQLKKADPNLLGVRAEGVQLILQRQTLQRQLAPLHDIHAWLLDYTTKFAEIAVLPPEQQRPRLRELAATTRMAPPEALPLLAALPVLDIEEMSHKGPAFLRCAAVGVALERYRLANGNWPDKLDGLVPKYLAKVPDDPFDGKPLRYAQYKEGVAVYSVGSAGKEGVRPEELGKYPEDGSFVSLRLWNVESRQKPTR
jgi:hypothetical protein